MFCFVSSSPYFYFSISFHLYCNPNFFKSDSLKSLLAGSRFKAHHSLMRTSVINV